LYRTAALAVDGIKDVRAGAIAGGEIVPMEAAPLVAAVAAAITSATNCNNNTPIALDNEPRSLNDVTKSSNVSTRNTNHP
jgi:hypothetical protein